MNFRTLFGLITTAVVLAAFYVIGYLGIWQWSICRIEVPAGSSLLIRYKGPFPFGRSTQAPEGTLVRTDSAGRPQAVGILDAMPGPGRHFYSPLEYETKLVEDTIIAPGEIGVVTSKVGKPLPAGEFLAESGYRGIQRRVLTPGRYRINPYAFDVAKQSVAACLGSTGGVQRRDNDALLIPPGYVGVVTNKAANPRTGQAQGTQDNVLQPGIYYLNPAEKRVDILSVGYNQTTLEVEPQTGRDGTVLYQPAPKRPEGAVALTARDPVYVPGQGIEFPSKDGFPIHLDFTAIWGILPDQAAGVIRQFGSLKGADGDTIKAVEQTVILPQIGSITRLHGSRQGAVDLLVGDTREAFQTDTSEELETVLKAKNLTLLFGLARHIYVPAAVREPMQRAKIADELKLTRDQEQLTAEAEGDLKEAKAKVTLEERRTNADTAKQVAQLIAEGEKKAREIEATTEKLRAEIDAKTAAVQAQITTTLGEAEAKKTELANQAQAERYRQYVQSLGGPDAYNRYVFAEGLPADLRLGVFYAGPGTFWTDLKGIEQVLLGKLA
ncbi:MAG TPA: SPFH domain-containing protein, partial [Isosphaeraceae bacterium]